MKLTNEWYDFLSLMGRIILPSIAVFYQKIAEIWNLPYSDKIPPTIMAIVVLLNSCLGISSATYYKNLANNVLGAEGSNVEDLEHALGVEDVEHSLGAEDGDTDKG